MGGWISSLLWQMLFLKLLGVRNGLLLFLTAHSRGIAATLTTSVVHGAGAQSVGLLEVIRPH